ncbi:MAG: alpha/beta hydrolase [Lachnospiraceae bacterium]|nr:alpha/beta hydrolase [Lachnospiraceae bacterium]
MFLNAKNGCLDLRCGKMDYVRFGKGERIAVMIPGVGDGLKTVKGFAIPFAILYRKFAKQFTVYVFSRKRDLPEKMTTRDMASDLNEAFEALGLKEVNLIGISQGGMISQWMAIDHPEKVSKLVLTVTHARAGEVAKDVIPRWMEMAKRGGYKEIMMDTAERAYSPARLESSKKQYMLLGNYGRPKSFDRFLIQAESCMTHNAYDELDKITCPTLVIGGSDDRIVGGRQSEELAEKIPGAKLHIYEGLGHGLYEEAPDFFDRVAGFFISGKV